MTAAKKLADVFGIVAFVETDVLMAHGGLGAMDRQAVEGGLEKFDVMSVGTTDRHSQVRGEIDPVELSGVLAPLTATPKGTPSIDNPFEEHGKCRWRCSEDLPAGDLLGDC